jgi:hypothetical protein
MTARENFFMKKLSLGRQATAVALMLITIITFTTLPASAQESAASATKPTVFTATTAAGENIHITASKADGTIKITLRASTANEQVFRFSAKELSDLFAATKAGRAPEGPLAATGARVREFRAAAQASLDRRSLRELTRQIGASELAAGKTDNSHPANATGVSYVKTAASFDLEDESCTEVASRIYQSHGIYEALIALLSCYLFA